MVTMKLTHGTYTSEGTMNCGTQKIWYCKSSDCRLRLSSLHAYKLLLRYFEINQEPRFFPFILMYYWIDVSTIYKFPVISVIVIIIIFIIIIIIIINIIRSHA